jgi:hypothetical protein
VFTIDRPATLATSENGLSFQTIDGACVGDLRYGSVDLGSKAFDIQASGRATGEFSCLLGQASGTVRIEFLDASDQPLVVAGHAVALTATIVFPPVVGGSPSSPVLLTGADGSLADGVGIAAPTLSAGYHCLLAGGLRRFFYDLGVVTVSPETSLYLVSETGT